MSEKQLKPKVFEVRWDDANGEYDLCLNGEEVGSIKLMALVKEAIPAILAVVNANKDKKDS